MTRLTASHKHVPLLDPTTDLKVEGKALRKALSKLESVESALRDHPLARHPQLLQRLAVLQQRQGLEAAMQVSHAVAPRAFFMPGWAGRSD